MKTCIYCKSQDQSQFRGVEHLIPQCFGTFGSNTPTLDYVCDQCNAFFAKELDQILARDSWEGISRYKKGIKSREQRPLKRLKLSLEKIPEMGGFGGLVFGGIDSSSGKLLLPKGQFHIKNIKTGEYDIFYLGEIKKIELNEETYGKSGKRDTKIFGATRAEHQEVLDEVKVIIPTYTIKEEFSSPFIEVGGDSNNISIPIWIEGRIDKPIKRALVKILLNFVAYYIGKEEFLKSEWDDVRNFVRFDTDSIMSKATADPFWGDETTNLRLMDDSFNICIENEGKNVIGKIQIYNHYTYIFILVKNYNIPTEKETAMRFTKGKKPFIAEKRTRA